MKTMPFPVMIPLLNPNEPEARLISIYVSEGQHVSKEDILCTLETTKSTSDLVAEVDGYITGIQYTSGDSVVAGDVFCHLADSPVANPLKSRAQSKPSIAKNKPGDDRSGDLPPGLRITQPALALVKKYQLNLEQLPTDSLITERYIQTLVEKHIPPEVSLNNFDPTRVIVYGGGGHGKSLIELIRSLGDLRVHGIIDDGLVMGESVLGCPVLGGEDNLSRIYDLGIHLAVNAVGGIGNIHSRIKVFDRLTQSGFYFPILIHPSAVIESSASLSPGVQVFPHAYIGSETCIGFGVIINTGAVISHDCIVEDYANISPGALLAGGVTIGARTLIGMGVTINLGVSIGSDVRIGNSAVVKGDVPAGRIIRAGSIWPE
jgi:sugar O-acyltransferase (sialic acid O-acetyltransferase NeuD family)